MNSTTTHAPTPLSAEQRALIVRQLAAALAIAWQRGNKPADHDGEPSAASDRIELRPRGVA